MTNVCSGFDTTKDVATDSERNDAIDENKKIKEFWIGDNELKKYL